MKYIVPYNNEWPIRFNAIAQFLRGYIPDGCLIHHVGSTAVPGMPAKDIIDVDVECPDGSMASVIEALERARYDHEGDLGIPTREAFKPRIGSTALSLPCHHLYACETRSPELFKHIAFRDYLICHPTRAEWLASQKVRADELANSRAEYIENKSSAYETIEGEILSWADRALQRTPTSGAGDLNVMCLKH